MSGPPPRKLPRTGYPRRRAVTACRVCRERKKKCDNARPTCSSCQGLGAQCEYGTAQDEASYDAASLTILSRLSTMESLLKQIAGSVASTSPSGPEQLNPSTVGSLPVEPHDAPTPLHSNFWVVDTGANLKLRTDKVLQWPVFEEPLSSFRRHPVLNLNHEPEYSYLEDTASQQAYARNDSRAPLNISAEASDIERLVDRFFTGVHIKNPILDRKLVKEYCREYYENGPLFNLRACLVLLIAALGCIATELQPGDRSSSKMADTAEWAKRADHLRLGQSYFAAAEKRLGSAMITSSSLAVQCLCLAGIYHMCTLNPVAAQGMFHAAGFTLQTMISTGADRLEGTSQVGSSLCWACYKSERELFSELPIALPALGRPDQASGYPLPPQERFILSDSDVWTRAEEDSWYFFLSEIALRRIKDKIAEVVGTFFDNVGQSPQQSAAAIEELAPVALELERQIIAWREHLPPRVDFNDTPLPEESEWSIHLRGPFFWQLETIHRPFTYAAIHDPNPTPMIMAMAAKGMTNAFYYLQSGHPTLRHHGRWLQLRFEMVVMAIMIAASAAGVQMPRGWRDAVETKLESFQYWKKEAPFCKSHIDIVRAIEGYFIGNGEEDGSEEAGRSADI